MAALSELLPVGAIRLGVPAADWREAIGAAGELMVATGTSTAAYTAEMIANVEVNGPYVVIAPGLAFAHARPSPAVLRTGMSWVGLEQPVEFGHEANDPVRLVVGLAAKDSGAHQSALAALAELLADPGTAQALEDAVTPEAVHGLLAEAEAEVGAGASAIAGAETILRTEAEPGRAERSPAGAGPAVHKVLTVCGNGLGTSLFLKNTLERVLERWNWSPYVTVEATDTISARGKASEAVAVLTSGEIAKSLGDVGVPVKVVENFTSTTEVDSTLRDIYDV